MLRLLAGVAGNGGMLRLLAGVAGNGGMLRLLAGVAGSGGMLRLLAGVAGSGGMLRLLAGVAGNGGMLLYWVWPPIAGSRPLPATFFSFVAAGCCACGVTCGGVAAAGVDEKRSRI